MKRVKLMNGRDFVLSAMGDIAALEINAAIVKMLLQTYAGYDIFIDKDPYQTKPQGYIFYIKSDDPNPQYEPLPLAIYDWELEKFFKVFD